MPLVVAYCVAPSFRPRHFALPTQRHRPLCLSLPPPPPPLMNVVAGLERVLSTPRLPMVHHACRVCNVKRWRRKHKRTADTKSHLIGVYHCEGTARTVGLELLSQLPPNGQQEDELSQSGPPRRTCVDLRTERQSAPLRFGP